MNALSERRQAFPSTPVSAGGARAFVESVRFALRDQRFLAATRDGRPVHQVMQLPFNFVPDSTAVRRKR